MERAKMSDITVPGRPVLSESSVVLSRILSAKWLLPSFLTGKLPFLLP